MLKVSPGAKTVPSSTDWETHRAWFTVPAPGVPVIRAAVALAVGVADRAGVEVGGVVAVGLGRGVMEGVRRIAWVTSAHTVAATSVRRGFRSGVGVLVGVCDEQAVTHSRLNNTPVRTMAFIKCAIWFILFLLFR